jgi:hypothetical protein
MNIFRAITPKSSLLVGSLLAMGIPAFAIPVTGVIGFSGKSLFTFTLAPGASYIDFRDPTDGGYGVIDADNRLPLGGFFDLNVPDNAPGTIRDMTTSSAPSAYAYVPVNTTVSIDDFLTFGSIVGTTNIRLTKLPFADCSSGGTCVGPFQLSRNVVGDVSVTIGIIGEILNDRNSPTPDITKFTGTITAQFLQKQIADVINQASNPGGIAADSYSGAILAYAETGVPEPATWSMLGIGAVAMFLGRLRVKRGSSN